MNTFQATERALEDYKLYKKGAELSRDAKIAELSRDAKIAAHNIAKIDAALELLKDDQYIGIIILHYFQGMQYEAIAQVIGCDERTVFRQRRRLINQIKIILFPDDVVRETFGGVN